MKKFFAICLVGIFSFALSGCGGEDESAENSDETNIEIAEQKFFLEALPNDWSVFPENTYSDGVVFAAEEPTQMDDVDTLIVVSEYGGLPNSLENFTRRSVENIRKKSQDFYLISQEDITLSSGNKAKFIHFSDRNGVSQQVHFYTLFTISPKKSQSYTVSIMFDPNTTQGHKEFLKNILLSYNPYGKKTRD
jgi:hypothetical protein